MRISLKWAFLLLLVPLVPAGLSALTETEIRLAHPNAQDAPVTVRRAQPSLVSDMVQAFGQIAPQAPITVTAPPKTAVLTEIAVQPGDLVAQGQVLARLDPTDALREKQRAERGLAAIEAEARLLQTQLAALDREVVQKRQALDRLAQLAKSGATSDVRRQDAVYALDRAKLDYAAARNKLERATADIAMQKLDIEWAQRMLDATVIRAPMAGRVVAVHPTRGSQPQPGEALFRIAKDDQMEAVLQVAPWVLPQLEAGHAVKLWLSEHDSIFTQVSRVDRGQIDAGALGTVAVNLPAGTSAVSGAPVRAEIITGQRQAIMVPYSAIVPLPEGPAIMRVLDQRAVASPVELRLHGDGTAAEVVQGLPEGAPYIAIAGALVRDGDTVAQAIDAGMWWHTGQVQATADQPGQFAGLQVEP